jgi:hypothetical protein
VKAPRKTTPHTEDDRRVRTTLDRWVERDRKCRALHRNVRKAEQALRKELTKDAWKLYLLLEEQINARHIEIVGAAIRFAQTPRKTR